MFTTNIFYPSTQIIRENNYLLNLNEGNYTKTVLNMTNYFSSKNTIDPHRSELNTEFNFMMSLNLTFPNQSMIQMDYHTYTYYFMTTVESQLTFTDMMEYFYFYKICSSNFWTVYDLWTHYIGFFESVVYSLNHTFESLLLANLIVAVIHYLVVLIVFAVCLRKLKQFFLLFSYFWAIRYT